MDKSKINSARPNNLPGKSLSDDKPVADASLKNLLKSDNVLKGDIDDNGEVNDDDYEMLDDFLHGKKDDSVKLTEKQQRVADMNGDNKLGENDLYNIGSVLFDKLFKSVKVNPNLEGDFNSDGKVDEKDIDMLYTLGYVNIGLLSGQSLTKEQFKAADINHDGSLNGGDTKELLRKIEKNASNEPENTRRPRDANIVMGDLNFDGKIDYDDQGIIIQYYNGGMKEDGLTEKQKEAADMNNDGKVHGDDVLQMLNEVQGSYLYSLNPGDIHGDLNNDKKVDGKDLQYFVAAEDFDHYGYLPKEMKPLFDINQNGKVDQDDINIFKQEVLKEPLAKIEFTPLVENDSKNWMVSQNRGYTNLHAGSSREFNGNCAPTSLLMVARMFGKIGGGAEEAQNQIVMLRKLADDDNQMNGVPLYRLGQAAEKIGLTAEHISQGSMTAVKKALAEGKKVILGVNTAKYSMSGDSAHAIVVTAVDGNNFTVYDPGFQKPITVNFAELSLALDDMLIVGDPSQKNSNAISSNPQSKKPTIA